MARGACPYGGYKLQVESYRLAHPGTVNVEAYEFFLRAREQAWSHTRTAIIEARRLAGAAIAVDPGYASAHALIAFTHVVDYANAWSNDPEHSLRIALELAQQAVAMTEEQPDGHFALGLACMFSRELDRARSEAQRGLALSPNSVDLLMLMAQIQIFSGDPAGALETLRASMALDPHYPELLLQFVADAHFSLGEYEQALATIKQRLARNPESETAYALLASCHGHLGHPAESRQAWEQALKTNPGFSMERRSRVQPFRNPGDFQRRVDGLRKAGLTV